MKKFLEIVIILIIISISLTLFYISNKNKDNVEFKVLYNGFITINLTEEILPPNGPIVFTSYKQWEDFGKNYLPNYYQILYSYITMYEKVNFNEDYLVFQSSIGAKTWYNLSFGSLEKVLIQDNKLKVVDNEEKKDIINGIYAPNEQIEIAQPNILIFTVRKDDIPPDLENLYSEKKDYRK